jgi:hypothetical protein
MHQALGVDSRTADELTTPTFRRNSQRVNLAARDHFSLRSRLHWRWYSRCELDLGFIINSRVRTSRLTSSAYRSDLATLGVSLMDFVIVDCADDLPPGESF